MACENFAPNSLMVLFDIADKTEDDASIALGGEIG
jgi:hypothetical protein